MADKDTSTPSGYLDRQMLIAMAIVSFLVVALISYRFVRRPIRAADQAEVR